MKTTRRGFMAAVSAAGAATALKSIGANDRVRVGVMGARGRGRALAAEFARRDDAAVVWLCDVNARAFAESAAAIRQLQNAAPRTTQDYRAMLDDAGVDAIVNATPDHWHALGTIHACQAGKDVFTEKPASHSLWEGRKMVEAARKYKRVVQMGTQTRSAPYARAAIEHLRSGALGDIHYVRVLNMKHHGALRPEPDGETPEGIDYDRWLGPAPLRPFNPNHFWGGRWNWLWAYSGGDIINDGVHQLDLARWAIDRAHPRSVHASGGLFQLNKVEETPDTLMVTYDFDGLIMTFELTLWTPYMQKTPLEIRAAYAFPSWPHNATKVEIFGTRGMMVLGRHGGGWQVWEADGSPGPFRYGRPPTPNHIQDFIECMWSRKMPSADIEEGHRSTVLCHMANISYRLGGRALKWDGDREVFPDAPDANAFLKRTYRPPYVVPEEV